MDRPARWVSAAALAVALSVAVGAILFAPEPRSEPEASTAEKADVERRLARLEGALAREPSLTSPVPVAGDGAVDAARLSALERKVEELAARLAVVAAPAPSPSSLSDAELLARARALGAGAGDWKDGTPALEALAAWEEVLRRNPDAATASEGWEVVGYAHRQLKAHDREEAAFREAVRHAAGDPAREAELRFQLGWAQAFRGESTAARETMSQVARSRDTPRDLRGHALLNEGRLALELQDLAGARRAYEEVLRDHSGSAAPLSAWFVEQAKGNLKGVEGR